MSGLASGARPAAPHALHLPRLRRSAPPAGARGPQRILRSRIPFTCQPGMRCGVCELKRLAIQRAWHVDDKVHEHSMHTARTRKRAQRGHAERRPEPHTQRGRARGAQGPGRGHAPGARPSRVSAAHTPEGRGDAAAHRCAGERAGPTGTPPPPARRKRRSWPRRRPARRPRPHRLASASSNAGTRSQRRGGRTRATAAGMSHPPALPSGPTAAGRRRAAHPSPTSRNRTPPQPGRGTAGP